MVNGRFVPISSVDYEKCADFGGNTILNFEACSNQMRINHGGG